MHEVKMMMILMIMMTIMVMIMTMIMTMMMTMMAMLTKGDFGYSSIVVCDNDNIETNDRFKLYSNLSAGATTFREATSFALF